TAGSTRPSSPARPSRRRPCRAEAGVRPKDRIRRLRRSAWLRAVLCWLIQSYIRVVFVTNRWRVEGGEISVRLRERHRGGVIFAFWHGRMLMIPRATPRPAPVQMLISGHPDG